MHLIITEKKSTFLNIVATFATLLITTISFSQSFISGVIKDETTGETMIGASVVIKGTTTGITTDLDGKFELKTDKKPPFTLSISFMGYITKEYEVTNPNEKIKLSLGTNEVMLEAVEIVDSRLTEKQKEAAQTIEAMDVIAIKETPSANFYDGLGLLKGVDITAASIGFKVINTRGFNSTSPVRSLQIIDGVDNQAPGLNFALGNFLGASELDMQKVEIIVGANGALYGPNAFNGVISMTTKDPFLHQGLSVMEKVGERGLNETAVRYAKAFKNKAGEDKFGFKVNFFYMAARDWEATNMGSASQSIKGKDNPGGYDAVNRYGDENLRADYNNFESTNGQIINNPGLGIIYRNGYEEKNLVDYNTKNIKANAALHYKFAKDIQLIATSNFGNGTTVYQGDNRYSLKDILFFQNRLELNKKDKFYLRAYATHENAGNSYDAVFTAFLLQKQASKDDDWGKIYQEYWAVNINKKIKNNPNSPFITDKNLKNSDPDAFILKLNDYFSSINDSLLAWHTQAREFANSENPSAQLSNDHARLEPGTTEFDEAKKSITSKNSFLQGGSGFYDKSALYHIAGEYKFEPLIDSIKFMDIIVGGNYRIYTPNSQGTIFDEKPVIDSTLTNGFYVYDTSFTKITNKEFGIYAGVEKKLIDERLKLNGTLRMDKNQNFDYLFSPALSAVYVHDMSTFRLSFSSAIRNPTLGDQYLHYNVGRAILLGNLHGYDSLITIESMFDYFNSPFLDTTLLSYFNIDPIRPEKVKTIEVGYRSTLFKQLYVDASYYYSLYKDFIGYQIGADIEFDKKNKNQPANIQAYRIASNASDRVTTQGFSLGLNYYFNKYYAFNGNYSWNRLNTKTDDPIIPAYNTPEHKYNIGISARDIITKIGTIAIRNWGFNVNYKWIQGFQYQGSPQFTGFVPTYDMVDMQINYRVPKIFSTFKLGVSNLFGVAPLFRNAPEGQTYSFGDKLKNAFDNKNMQVYGGPFVGRMIYFSIVFETDKL